MGKRSERRRGVVEQVVRAVVESLESRAYFSIPAAPASLAASAASISQINLSWADQSTDETGFKIERSSNGGSSYSQIASVGSNVTSFNNTALASQTTYTYRVRSYNADGNSAYTAVASDTTAGPPAAPSDLVATPLSVSQIRLNWTNNDSGISAATTYKVERSSDGGATFTQIVGSLTPGTTSFTSTGLTAGATYQFRVRASNGYNSYSVYSNTAEAVTVNPPAAPSNMSATVVSPVQVNLSWTRNDTTPAATSYKIEASTDGGSTFTQIYSAPASWSSFSPTNLTPATAYVFRVRAYNGAYSAYSNTASATTPAIPTAPANLTATAASTTQIDLSWTPTDGGVATSYVLEKSLNGGSTYTTLATLSPGVSSFSYTSANALTDYTFRTRATNGVYSPASNIVAITSARSFPSPSNLIAVTVSNNQVDLDWTDNSDNESGFIIDRKVGTGQWRHHLVAPPNTTHFSDTNLPDSTTPIQYRVATDTDGVISLFSNASETTTSAIDPGPGVYLITLGAVQHGMAALDTPVDNLKVVGDGLVAANSLKAAIRQAIAGNAVVYPTPGLPYNDGQTKTFIWGDSESGGAFLAQVSPSSDTAGLYTGQVKLEDTFGWGPSDKDYNDDYWDLMAQKIEVDIDVDSNNDVAIDPDNSAAGKDDKIEADDDKPGKIIAVNSDDIDGDGIIDWADGFNEFTDTPGIDVITNGAFTPVVLTLPSEMDVTKARLKLIYSDSDPSKVLRSGTGDEGDPYIYHLPNDSGSLRLWTQLGNWERDGRSIENGGDWIKSDEEFDASKLFGSDHAVVVWVEGIKASASQGDQQITLSVKPTSSSTIVTTDLVRLTSVHADLGFNNADAATKTNSPDVDFTIDQTDDRFEDTDSGVSFWWSRDQAAQNGAVQLTKYGLEDLLPFRLDVSQIPDSIRNTFSKVRISLSDVVGSLTELVVHAGLSPADNRTKFLSDNATANQQVDSAAGYIYASGGQNYTQFNIAGQDMEFVLAAIGSNKATFKLKLELVDAANRTIELDSAKLTLRPVEDYWALWSTRGARSTDYSYPIENGTPNANVKLFPEAQYVPLGTGDHLPGVLWDESVHGDANRQVSIFVHGYNCSREDAIGQYNTTYRRLFWQGYRGSFIGFNWEGDDTNVNPLGQRSLFDPNVYNAFMTAPRYLEFLAGPVYDWTAQHPEHIDIMAHSMGNLVTFEALRLGELQMASDAKLVNNVIAVEAAVWKEAFEPQTDLTYPDPNQNYQGDPVTYTIDEQRRSSWRFWFRQKDANGNERNLKRLLTGKIFDSYNPNDFALDVGMRSNDIIMHSGGPVPGLGRNQYDRDINNNLRTLSESFGFNSSMETIPALMQNRELTLGYYGPSDLNMPLGAINPNSELNLKNYFDIPIDAQADGWPVNSHGAAFYSGDKPNGLFTDPYDVSSPVVWAWYKDVFNSKQGVRLGNV